MADQAAAIQTQSAFQQIYSKEFFLGRQPILDREQQLFAYELLFRDAAAGPANVMNDAAATAAVIARAFEIGLVNVLGASRGFVNVDATVLESDFIQFLPKQNVVLEILETVKITDALIARVEQLHQLGYAFALDDVVADSDGVQRMLPHVDIIKIDIQEMSQSDLLLLSRTYRQAGKRLLAEKVETLDQYQQCLDLEFEYFQGYYFARPTVLSGKTLSPPQLAIMRLLSQLGSNADLTEIERSVKQDASLGLSLLRLVNAPAHGSIPRIDTLGQAIRVLGRGQLQRWLQILLYAQSGQTKGAASPLLALAITRGRLLELVAEKIRPNDRNFADAAFTIGIMSLTDALFGLPTDQILSRLSVTDEIKDALLTRSGIYGDMLTLCESVERIQESGTQVAALLKKLQLSTEEFYALQLAAFEWSDTISRNAS